MPSLKTTNWFIVWKSELYVEAGGGSEKDLSFPFFISQKAAMAKDGSDQSKETGDVSLSPMWKHMGVLQLLSNSFSRELDKKLSRQDMNQPAPIWMPSVWNVE